MVLGSFTSIRADPWTKIPDPALTTLSGSVHWPRSDNSRSPAPDLMLPNPHSARGTPTDLRSRVPSLEPFRRRPTALAATLVIGPASETLHTCRHSLKCRLERRHVCLCQQRTCWPTRKRVGQVIRRMLAAISSGSKTRFQSSRIRTGTPNSIALLQASENWPSISSNVTAARIFM